MTTGSVMFRTTVIAIVVLGTVVPRVTAQTGSESLDQALGCYRLVVGAWQPGSFAASHPRITTLPTSLNRVAERVSPRRFSVVLRLPSGELSRLLSQSVQECTEVY